MEAICGPARIKVLVVPGTDNWLRGKYISFVDQLRATPDVKLVDITPIEDPHFNPQGFPQGNLLFDIQTEIQDEGSMMFLHDFEPYRKTFVVIGLCEGSPNEQDAKSTLEKLEAEYPSFISHCLIYEGENSEGKKMDNVFSFKDSSKTIMCDVGRCFLQSLSNYYRSYKHVTLRSPGAIGGTSISKTTFVRKTSTTLTKLISSSLEPKSGSVKKSSTTNGSMGPTNVTDKSQQRSKGRQLKILAHFQLLSGKYMDALTNFSESAAIAHKAHDNLWLGSALEGIGLCIILLSSLSISFNIPSIVNTLCSAKSYTIGNSNNSTSQVSSVSSFNNANSSSPAQVPVASQATGAVQGTFKSPRSSSSSFHALQLNSNEMVLAFLLKSIHDKVLHYFELSLGQSVEYTPQVVYCQSLLRMVKFLTECNKGYMTADPILKPIIQAAYQKNVPNESKEGTLFPKVEIYQLCSRFFELQLKELDPLTQVRLYMELASIFNDLSLKRKRVFVLKLLFTTMLTNLQHFTWSDEFKQLAEDMLNTYGITDLEPESKVQDASEPRWLILQKNVLMLFVDMAHRLDDKSDLIRLSMLILTRYSHILTHAEQEKLLREYLLTSIDESMPSNLKYWDPFVLRMVTLLRMGSSADQLIKLESGVQKLALTNNDQVFNPLNRANSKTSLDHSNTFLVSENAEIVCTFQNPFKFHLEITSLELCKSDREIMQLQPTGISKESPFIVKAGSMKSFSGTVVFHKSTSEAHEITHMEIGAFNLPSSEYPISLSEELLPCEVSRAKLGSCKLTIIQDQPHLESPVSSLPNNSIMIPDGTKRSFTFVLHNTSLSRAADYLQFSSATNVEKLMRDNYWLSVSQDQLYDTELRLKFLKEECIKFNNLPTKILPNQTVNIEVEVNTSLAGLDLEHVDIMVQYGCREPDGSVAYAKSLVIPFKISQRRNIELTSLEIISLHDHLPELREAEWVQYLHNKIAEENLALSDFSLMLVDIRNSWTNKATLEVEYSDFKVPQQVVGSYKNRRIIIPIRNIEFSANFQDREIPTIVTGRQFIHSGLRDDQLRDLRIRFWCRERILSNLKCHWTIKSDSGYVNFRSFMPKLEHTTINTICRWARYPYKLQLSTSESKIPEGDRFTVAANVDSNYYGKESKTISIQFQFFERRTGKQIPAMNTVLIYNGALTHSIDLKSDKSVKLDIVPIKRGEYELHAHILNTSLVAYSYVHVI
ncbi:HHL258Wp [Eremothecium sinecaudum]|uniref:HHL258Wp n=1 Tax=Eremothecium sinecaudum TaxID=45286 RepID=A0A0X8HW14_9SACH|nr:HHL258Wp [Eremothecium sinecaudum]AMD22512.1 HHL258Wp [Eremothecium sinecaudum]